MNNIINVISGTNTSPPGSLIVLSAESHSSAIAMLETAYARIKDTSEVTAELILEASDSLSPMFVS